MALFDGVLVRCEYIGDASVMDVPGPYLVKTEI
jgi:hypothetical protein